MHTKAQDDLPVLDPAWLERMLGTRPDFVRKLFEVFLADEPARVAAMAQAIEQGDLELLRYLAHSLKGAAATLGMPRVSAACRELEFAAREGRSADLAACQARVAGEMDILYEQMRMVMPQA